MTDTDPAFEERFQALLVDELARIDEHPTETSGGVDFAYTAGLTPKGQPELFVIGLPPETAQQILNAVVPVVLANGCQDGDIIDGVIHGYQVVLRRPVDPRAADMPCSIAQALYDDVEVALVAWPDDQHRMPWDDGFAAEWVPRLAERPPTETRRLVAPNGT